MDAVASALLDASPDAVLVSNGGGRVLLANPAAVALTGRPLEQLVGTPLEELLDDTLVDIAQRMVHEVATPIDRTRSSSGSLLHVEGRRRSVEVTLARLDLDDHPSVALYLRPLPCEPSADELSIFRSLLDAVVAARALPEVLDRATRGATDLFGADGAGVVRLDPTNQSVEVVAACGMVAQYLGARVLLEGTRVQAAIAHGAPMHFVESGVLQHRSGAGAGPAFGELWVVPLEVDGATYGALALATEPGQTFRPGTDERLAPFVDLLSLAIEITEASQHRSALAMVADHERIARDLHDVVIQRLIASAMRLESMLRQVDNTLRTRLSRVIDDLDRVTRDIRSTVFHLQRDEDGDELAAQIAELTSSTAEAFGLEAQCRVEQVSTVEIPEGLRAHLLAVTREALSNVGRHASATEVSVEVRLDNPLVLQVTDNGEGLSAPYTPGNGLKNLASRAEELGGALTLTPAQPTGTVLRWEIPWPRVPGGPLGSAASL